MVKYVLVFLFTMLSSAAFAETTELSSGLNCSMEYSSSNMFTSYKESTSAWLVAGSELASTAVAYDGDADFAGTSSANYINVSTVKVAQDSFWQIQILNSEKSLLSTFSFGAEAGLQVVIPTRAFQPNESEDPTEYDTLTVTCHYTIFAG